MRCPAGFFSSNVNEKMADENDFLLDEVSGRRRKPIMSILNKGKLSRYEMDELFCEEI